MERWKKEAHKHNNTAIICDFICLRGSVNEGYRERLGSHFATVTVPPHQLGGSGLLQHNSTSNVSTLRRRRRIQAVCLSRAVTGGLQTKSRLCQYQRTLGCPFLKTWLSVKLLFHRFTVHQQEALRRGQASWDTLPFLSSSASKDDIILPRAQAFSVVLEVTHACTCSVLCRSRKSTEHHSLSKCKSQGRDSHTEAGNLPSKAGSSVQRNPVRSGSPCGKWNEAEKTELECLWISRCCCWPAGVC